jgi:small subunit ribosomal protein S16
MVKIRLMRMGKRKQPYYRVVVADSRSPRDGRFIENIGKYHPRAHPSVIDIDEERALHWLKNGAQPSDPVRVLLQKTGIWSAFTGQPLPAQTGESSDSASPADEPGSAEPSGPPSEAEASPEEEALGSSEGGADKPPNEEGEEAP